MQQRRLKAKFPASKRVGDNLDLATGVSGIQWLLLPFDFRLTLMISSKKEANLASPEGDRMVYTCGR